MVERRHQEAYRGIAGPPASQAKPGDLNDTRERPIQTICLLVLTGLALLVAAYWLANVLSTFVLAVFLAWSLTPLMDFLERRFRFPPPLAVVTTLLLTLAGLLMVAALVSASVAELVANKDLYVTRFHELVVRAETSLPAAILGIRVQSVLDQVLMGVTNNLGGALAATTNGLLGLLSQGAMVILYVLFLVVARPQRTLPKSPLMRQIDMSVKRYLVSKALLSVLTGILVGSTLRVLGVELAMVFGLLAGLLNFIPNLGSLVSSLLPLPLVLFSPTVSAPAAVLAIVVPGVLHFIIGNVIEPKVMGDSLDLHPVVVLLTLMIGGAIWGVVGMLLSTPITAILKLLLEQSELTAPAASVLAGRLPSEP